MADQVGDATPGKASRVGRGLGWSLLSTVLLRVGNLAVSVLVARLVAPETYGVFAVALTVWMLLSALSEFGLGADLVRAQDPARRAPTVATLGAVIGLVAAAAMAVTAGEVAAAFGSPESTDALRVMSLVPALFGLTIVPAALLQRAYRQRALFGVYAAGLVASAGCTVSLILLGAGATALAWGQVAGQAVMLVALHVAASHRPRFGLDGRLARESLSFSIPLAVANLVSWTLITVDNLIVSRELGIVALGLYVLAFNVSSWPMSAVGQAVRVVALPAFAETESARERNEGLLRSTGLLVMVAAAMGVGLATMATSVVTLLYGERWTAAAGALVGLAVFGASRVLLDLVATFLIAAGETRAVLLVQLLWLACMVPAMVVAVRAWGLAGAGWAHVVVVVVVVVPAYGVALRRVGVDVSALAGTCVLPLVAAVPATVACWVLARSGGPPLLLLAGGAACVVGLYLLPMLPWARRRLSELRHPLGDAEAVERIPA
ncbi:oligosaccharide flippase family protein [Nocardioides pinisoli]|uniref:Oligosaccharide flippase family protein n=1 Tax=Nocardioides pinisoli TaxID=2950279 RepID=A0ABT1KZ21_9ACTN|nr:oligosaccharide flippase family protein [Nocardioides pinisoli]MCP3423020.1 oligosaccharide flippase family protein [Nocardioides pinisoli]